MPNSHAASKQSSSSSANNPTSLTMSSASSQFPSFRFNKAEEELIEIINQDIGHFAATKQGAIEEVESVAMSVFLICWPFVSCLQVPFFVAGSVNFLGRVFCVGSPFLFFQGIFSSLPSLSSYSGFFSDVKNAAFCDRFGIRLLCVSLIESLRLF